MANPTLLTISGSLRKGSYNRMLLAEAATVFGPATIDTGELNLPLYDGDLEAEKGVPESVQTLAKQVKNADAIVISSPEYNKGISGVLKNAFDWISRVEGMPFKGRPTVVMSANAGRTGGETGQFMVLSCLVPLQARVLHGPMLCVAAAGNEFDAEGKLTNDHYRKVLTGKMEALRAETG
ncbi:MAG: NADPH-dependent FMN reductase [Pseudomonadota bacterium]|uniref:NADPH-dependent FMN reductase n=1 Tax=Roseovarius TaxID=74030 RepID=UPI0022A8C237|nr:NADPH-dependent FMN reductase [Roseovarius sp. EGI FJ00037]MCZ0813606.1 NAD(P)H-dependent oxidoreductase [Roseovarius sp. EGI FJ00037]